MVLLALALLSLPSFNKAAYADTPTHLDNLSIQPPNRPRQINEILITLKASTLDDPAAGSTVDDGGWVTYTVTIFNATQDITVTNNITVTDEVPTNTLSGIECLPSNPANFACSVLTTPLVIDDRDTPFTIPVVTAVRWTINQLGPGQTAVGQFRGRAVCQPDGFDFQNSARLRYVSPPPNAGQNTLDSEIVGTEIQIDLPDNVGQPVTSQGPTFCSNAEDAGGFYDMDWGDYDADGDLDLLLVSGSTSVGVAVYRNNGNGQFTRLNFSFTRPILRSARWGRFNADNRLDIVVAGYWNGTKDSKGPTGLDYTYTGYNYVFTNSGGDNFALVDNDGEANQRYSFQSNDGIFRVAVGDYDGNGLSDVALGNTYEDAGGCGLQINKNLATANIFRVLLDASTVFTSGEVQCPVVAARVQGLDWGDQDNNSSLDLAAGINAGITYSIQVFEQDFFGTFFAPALPIAVPSPVYDVRWGDYNGDGFLDLAAALGGEVRVYQNNFGALNPSPVRTLSGFNTFVTAIDWLDFDGDGQLELAVADRPLRIYDNLLTSSDSFTDLSTGGSGSIYAVRGVDADNDGDRDITYINFQDRAFLLTTYAGFLASTLTSFSGSPGSSVALGDVDQGAIQGGSNNFLLGATDFNKLFEPDGSGSFQQLFAFTDYAASDIVLGDINSDGRLDIAAAGNKNRVWYFNNGPFSANPNWQSIPLNDTRGLSLGDADQDNKGRLDLIVTNRNARVQFYANQSLLAAQSNPTWSSVESGPGQAIAWGYLDSDILPDFVVGFDGQAERLYRNNGNNTFSLVTWSPGGGADSTRGVAWGDYDNDGDLDLAVANFSHPNYIYENKDGSLSPAPVWSSGAALNSTSVAWGDWDNDGDVDLAFGNNGQPDRVYANLGSTLGTPNFLWMWQASSSSSTQDISWADIDGDGDLDLAVAGTGQNGFYKNGYVAPAHKFSPNFPFSPINMPLPRNSAYLSVEYPKPPAGQVIWYRPTLSISNSLQIPVSFIVYDSNAGSRLSPFNFAGQHAVNTSVQYSVKGSNNWQPATGSTSFSSGKYTFNWQAGLDLDTAAKAVSDDTRLRITIVHKNNDGLIQRAKTSALSPPFRIRNLGCIWPEAATISFQPQNNLVAGAPVTFTGFIAAGSGPIIFKWDFGDGQTGTGQLVYHTYAQIQPYNVTLTVSSSPCPVTRSTITTTILTVANQFALSTFLPVIIKKATAATSISEPVINEPANSISSTTDINIPSLAITSGSPAQITDLNGHEPGDGTTRLEWNAGGAENGITGYRIYRSPIGPPSYQLLADLPAAVTTYADAAVSCGQMYFVTAYNDQGESLPSSASYFSPPCP